MALFFLDGFDHYAIGDMTTKWSLRNGTSQSMVTGRLGTGQAMRRTNHNQWVYLVTTNNASLTIGAAVKVSAWVANAQIFSVYDSTTLQCDVRIEADGSLRITKNGTTLTGAVTNGVIFPLNTWVYVEWQITIANSAQTSLRLNGSQVIDVTAQDTSQSANQYYNRVYVGGATSAAATVDVDDLYMLDTAGGTYLGDIRVDALKPDGNGNYTTNWSASSGQLYECVDEDQADGDTSYVSGGASVGDKITFTYFNLSAASSAGTIKGIQAVSQARKTDAGTKTMRAILRSAGADRFGSNVNLSTSHAFYRYIWETNPVTSQPFTYNEINALETGVDTVA